MKRAAVLCAALFSAACAHLHRADNKSVPGSGWDATVARAQQLADSGKYEAADRALADFISLHQNSHEATEAIFWRGLFKVDPNNKGGSLSAGISSFDVYLTSDSAIWHKPEAKVLRRTAALAQSLKLASSTQQQAAAVAPSADKDAMKSRDEEIASLREQLAKLNAELDRIKKRLANPKA